MVVLWLATPILALGQPYNYPGVRRVTDWGAGSFGGGTFGRSVAGTLTEHGGKDVVVKTKDTASNHLRVFIQPETFQIVVNMEEPGGDVRDFDVARGQSPFTGIDALYLLTPTGLWLGWINVAGSREFQFTQLASELGGAFAVRSNRTGETACVLDASLKLRIYRVGIGLGPQRSLPAGARQIETIDWDHDGVDEVAVLAADGLTIVTMRPGRPPYPMAAHPSRSDSGSVESSPTAPFNTSDLLGGSPSGKAPS